MSCTGVRIIRGGFQRCEVRTRLGVPLPPLPLPLRTPTCDPLMVLTNECGSRVTARSRRRLDWVRSARPACRRRIVSCTVSVKCGGGHQLGLSPPTWWCPTSDRTATSAAASSGTPSYHPAGGLNYRTPNPTPANRRTRRTGPRPLRTASGSSRRPVRTTRGRDDYLSAPRTGGPRSRLFPTSG